MDALPDVPNDGASYWKWDEVDLTHIYHSITVGGRYYAPNSVLASGGEPPLFLVEGVFYEGQALAVLPWTAPDVGEEPLSAWTILVNDYEGDLTVHMRSDEPGGRLWLPDADGEMVRADYTVDGQYLVFALPNGGSFLYTRASERADYTLWIAGAAAAAVAFGAVTGTRERRRREAAE